MTNMLLLLVDSARLTFLTVLLKVRILVKEDPLVPAELKVQDIVV